MHRIRTIVAAVAIGFVAATASAALAQGTAQVTGVAVSASSRGPVAGAKVELLQAERVVATAATDSNGAFAFHDLAAGTYGVRTTVNAFEPTTSAPFVLADGEKVALSVELQPITSTTLRTIGRIDVNGRASASNNSASITTIASTQFLDQGINQVQNALDQVPGVTIEHYDNGAPGAVATLSIRGAGGFAGGGNTGYEVLVLQDGEPLRNGQYGDFDLSSLTPAIYQRAELIKGVGGTSIFGANTIGGTLNLVTRDPLKSFGADAVVGTGAFGLGEYNLLVSDTVGKLGYLFDIHQYGTAGALPPNFVADFGGSFCGSNSGICDYATPSQLINLKSALGKLRYDFSPATSLTLSSSLESDYRDQLGLLANPTTGGPNNSSLDPHGIPYFFGYPGDYVWNTQPKYAADFHTQVLGGDLELRSYFQNVQRVVDGNGEPADLCCFESRSVDRLAGDEIIFNRILGNHSLTAGFGGNGDNYYSGSVSAPGPIDFTNFTYNAVGTEVERTYLVRDDYQATPKLNLSLSASYSDYDILNVRRIDPRFGAVYRPDNQTALRFSVGTGFGPPRISDIVQQLDLTANDASSAAQCPSSNQYCVASVGNRGLKAESATGYDLGFERNFLGRGNFTADVYRTDVYGHIFTALLPAPAGLTFTGQGGGSPVLYLNEPVNLAGTVFEGLEFSTKLPVPQFPQFALTGYYDTQAAYPLGVDPLTEAQLGNVVNKQQFQGVPLHKYGYGFDFESRDRRSSAFANGTFYADNNAYNLPSFWLWNLGFSVPLGEEQLRVTDSNVFNKNAFLFSAYNGGVPYGGLTGPYQLTAYPVQPHTIEVTLERKFGAFK